jgi:transcriptional regulator with XRE-family HTH domain
VTAPGKAGGSSATGPTVVRVLIGAQLRRLREGKGLTREEAGYVIRASESKISRLELGRVSFKERDVADLLSLYGVATDDPERARLLALVKEANTPGWWHRFGDVTPSWLEPYVGLEAAASLIRTYEIQFVPGLLQTREYAEAMVRIGREKAAQAEVERRVDLRLARQEILNGEHAPNLWAVIDEAALRRPIGGYQVLREQLEALKDATRRPNVQIQVVTFDVGGHVAMGGGYTILRFPDDDLADVIYVELLTSAVYLDRHEETDVYIEAMERLCAQARPPEMTPDIIEDILKSLP